MDLSQTGWRTSSYTNAGNNNCVEIGPAGAVVGIRDTKNRARGALVVRRSTFATMVRAVCADRLTA